MKSYTGRANINMHNMDCMEFMKDKPNDYYNLAIIELDKEYYDKAKERFENHIAQGQLF